MATTAREGRRGGRAARREARTAPKRRFLPVLKRTTPVYEILDAERLELIHDASLRILEEIGIDMGSTGTTFLPNSIPDIDGAGKSLAPGFEYVNPQATTTPASPPSATSASRSARA